jgi:glycosyltransferase involved in cell wall biosynthesis
VFVQPGDAEALAEALRRFAAEPEELASYRTAASARAVEAFRPAIVVAPLRDRLAGARR